VRKGRLFGFLLAAIPFAFIVIFVGLPTIEAIAYSLGVTGGPNQTVSDMAQNQIVAHHGITFGVYAQLWHTASFRSDFFSTVWVSLVSVLLQLLISYAIALYLRISDSRFARIVSTLYLIPMFIPGVIAAYALVTFWNQGGYADAIAHHLGDAHFPSFGYTLPGIIIGQIWTGLPFTVLLLASGLRSIPDSVVEAARDVGARWWTVCARVLIPMNLLPTVIVSTFAMIGALGAYTIPYLMGPTTPQMLGVAMTNYYGSYNEPEQAEAMAVMVFVVAAFVGFLYVWANLRLDRKSGASQ
jgi:ABC-type spermidine/putrescine transport system permease subunit I